MAMALHTRPRQIFSDEELQILPHRAMSWTGAEDN